MPQDNFEVMNLKQLKQALLIGARKGASYFHYTDQDSFLAMLKSGSMYLTRVDCLNDGAESFPASRRFYVGCFSASIGESVAMWAIYGRGGSDAVRLRFSGRILAEMFGGENNRVEIFETHAFGQGKCLGTAKVKMSKVAYASLTHPTFTVHKRRIVLAKFKDVRRDGLKPLWWRDLSPLAKKNPWMYESEVRLVVEVDKELDCEKIAIKFERPLKDLLEYNPKGHQRHLSSVLLGPWSGSNDGGVFATKIRKSNACPALTEAAQNFLTEQTALSELAGQVRLKGRRFEFVRDGGVIEQKGK